MPIMHINSLQIEVLKKSSEGRQAEMLLDIDQLESAHGEVVLLLGPSGSGKSLLTNLLLGFITKLDKEVFIHNQFAGSHFQVNLPDHGTPIEVAQTPYPACLERKIGIMFQSLGLLSDLSVEENLDFANDQAESPLSKDAWRPWKAKIATNLGLTGLLDSEVTKLSGGQRQRVALARLLAFRPKIMVFDEPTSALDIASARNVIQLINHTHVENRNLCSIIITHDYENFLAPRLVGEIQDVAETQRLLKALECGDRDPWALKLQELGCQLSLTAVMENNGPGLGWLIRDAEQHQKYAICQNSQSLKIYALTIADRVWFINSRQQIENHCPPYEPTFYVQQLTKKRVPATKAISALELARHRAHCGDLWWGTLWARFWQTLHRGIHQSWGWMWKFFGILSKLLVWRAVPYVALTGFCLGLVATYFSLNMNLGEVQLSSGNLVQVKNFILPSFFREMLSGFGVVMFRALIPLFACIFIASRSGTAITAYLSHMHDSSQRQWDALRNFGIQPTLFFLPQILLIFILGCWILSYLAFLCAAAGCLLMALYTNPLCSYYTWMQTFWIGLHPSWWCGIIPVFDGFGMFTIKTMCAGAAIALISFWFGTRERKSSLDIVKYLTAANIWNIAAILLIFFVLLLQEV